MFSSHGHVRLVGMQVLPNEKCLSDQNEALYFNLLKNNYVSFVITPPVLWLLQSLVWNGIERPSSRSLKETLSGLLQIRPRNCLCVVVFGVFLNNRPVSFSFTAIFLHCKPPFSIRWSKVFKLGIAYSSAPVCVLRLSCCARFCTL